MNGKVEIFIIDLIAGRENERLIQEFEDKINKHLAEQGRFGAVPHVAWLQSSSRGYTTLTATIKYNC